jgi:hypothetical protein
VVLKLASADFHLPRTCLGYVWIAYATVYVVWYAIAMLNGNPTAYINQDSLGFLLYVGMLPLLFLYVRFLGLEGSFVRFVIRCSTLIAGMSALAVLVYFMTFGEIDGDALLITNAFLAGLGLTWQLDNNSGVLGVYTNAGHLLLLGIALVLHRYTITGRKTDLALAALYLVGIALDGHRALIISAMLQLLILLPRLLARLRLSRKLLLAAVLVAIPLLVGVLGQDWIQERFDFSADDPSTAERHAQIPALLYAIDRNPVLGSGFGSQASYIRSLERPFSYEVDFLATAMKLGLLGTAIYFGTYLLALVHALLAAGRLGLFLFSAGLPFFFYMGTNGNQAMSTDSSVFHIFLFILIALSADRVRTAR